ncbi:glycosyltransferase [Aureimonas sp. AU40]|uniref:glycosyltransferase n=1 Tax=Aureimonas sp. AU40 TaxID=1637747 RepID=UPI000783E873|nr:glycosyltransferase [Aureimonas sp. AU40]
MAADPRTPISSGQGGVAVVIAVRNGLPFIREAVESALAQGPALRQVLVVDDGSDDGTREAVAGMADERVRLLRNPGRGVSSARNAGAARAEAEWLLFLDADDRLAPGALAALLDTARGDPSGPVAVYGDYERIAANGRAFGRRHLLRGRRAKPSGRILGDLLRGNFIINGGVVLVRAESFAASGGFDPALSLCEDWHLWCRLAALGPMLYTPRHVMDYRVHGASVMMGGHRRFADFQPALERIHADPLIRAGADPARLPAMRREAEVALMTYCAAQAYRNGARWPALRLALGAIAHHPRRAPYVAARFGGAMANF